MILPRGEQEGGEELLRWEEIEETGSDCGTDRCCWVGEEADAMPSKGPRLAAEGGRLNGKGRWCCIVGVSAVVGNGRGLLLPNGGEGSDGRGLCCC